MLHSAKIHLPSITLDKGATWCNLVTLQSVPHASCQLSAKKVKWHALGALWLVSTPTSRHLEKSMCICRAIVLANITVHHELWNFVKRKPSATVQYWCTTGTFPEMWQNSVNQGTRHRAGDFAKPQLSLILQAHVKHRTPGYRLCIRVCQVLS